MSSYNDDNQSIISLPEFSDLPRTRSKITIRRGVAIRLNKIQPTTLRFLFCAITATSIYRPT